MLHGLIQARLEGCRNSILGFRCLVHGVVFNTIPAKTPSKNRIMSMPKACAPTPSLPSPALIKAVLAQFGWLVRVDDAPPWDVFSNDTFRA
jgi:hypothetical protein